MAITSATIVVSVFLILVFPFAADFMKDPQFLETRSTFLVLLLASIIQNLSFIPHYDLYARSFDRDLMWATIFAAVVNIGLNVLLIPKFGILGAAWATATAFLTLLVAKTVFARIRFNETARAVDYGGQN
jgi:O-antigen/teichoic acid export membrane protein